MNQIVHNETIKFHQGNDFLTRPRLYNLLEKAMNYPLVVISAGSGYGKTRAVYSFLCEYNAQTTWLQISERDNIATRFWESYVKMLSLTWPQVAERFMEIGFPETEAAFAKFSAFVHESNALPIKQIMVCDDFHMLHNPAVLRHIEQTANILPPNATVILISRTIPDLNLIGMIMNDRVFIINEEDLCFTEDEIREYFNQLDIYATRQNIRNIYDDTQGWAFAINLIGRSLITEHKYERYSLEAMKKNIFRLMEAEISQSVSESLWRFLLCISLIDHLAANLIKELAKDDSLLKDMESLTAYVRYDFKLDTYMVHHLFLDYLHQNQHLLTAEEKRETYQAAGIWCENNYYQTDALSYYEKSGDWDAVLRIVYLYNFQMPLDIAKYTLDILERAPQNVASHYPLFPAMVLKLKINLGLLSEASALAKGYVQEYEALPASSANNRTLAEIYGAWANLQMLLCSYTDVYDFDRYYEKQRLYYDKTSYQAFGPVTKQPVGAFALLIGTSRAGAPEAYIEALTKAIPHTSHSSAGNMYGLDDLAWGELYYYRQELNQAEQYLKQALGKARAKDQYDIQSRSLLYLMLISFSRGDIHNAEQLLQSMEALLEVKDYDVRYESYDIARSHYYMTMGQPEQMPDWLKSDFLPCAHPAFLENYANRIRAQYYYLAHQHNTLLAFLENVRESQTLLMSRVMFKVLEALSLYQLKRRKEAIAVLTEAYELAAPNHFIVPFTQYAKDMRTLTSAALRNNNCTIPPAWLENINRKASAYSKRLASMRSEYVIANQIDEKLTLTKRETEILKDLVQGLSRTEIAAAQNISINTVKMTINTIYEKLHANSLVDAIRIASEHKVI